MLFSQQILSFIRRLHFPVELPPGIEVMNPFGDKTTMAVCTQFYKKYYSDNEKRRMVIGINPGRFGGGVTGIPFTDPVQLKQQCGIDNPWPLKQELSSVFVYDMIRAYGGAGAFYKKIYITAVSPLGFTKDNKNLNYYDDKLLQERIRHFAVKCFEIQLGFGIHRDVAFCLGDGKNFQYLSKLNKEIKLFDTIIPLSHPRFIMQYKLKKKQEYIDYYLKQFNDYCI